LCLFVLPFGVASVLDLGVGRNLLVDFVLIGKALFELSSIQDFIHREVLFFALEWSGRHVPTKRRVVCINVILVVNCSFDSQRDYSLSDIAVVERGQVCDHVNKLRSVAVLKGDTYVSKNVEG
jgi:hypothetical protein